MLTVEQFARIRQLRRDGLTIRQIAEQLNHSPKTILKALAHPEPTPTIQPEPRLAPVFGPFRDLVEAILVADETAPPSNATPPSRFVGACKRTTATPAATIKCVATSSNGAVSVGRRSFPWSLGRGSGPRRTSGTSTSISRLAGSWCRCCCSPGVTPTRRSRSRCRPNAAKRCCTACALRLRFSGVCRWSCGGITRRRWRFIFIAVASAPCTLAT